MNSRAEFTAEMLVLDGREAFIHQEIYTAWLEMRRNNWLELEGDEEARNSISVASDDTYQYDVQDEVEMICLCENCVKVVILDE